MKDLKQCKGKVSCGRWKSLSEFAFRKDNSTYSNNCKECINLYKRENYANNNEAKEKKKKYSQDNWDKIRLVQKEYRENEEHKIIAKERTQIWYQDNKEDALNYQKTYRTTNKDKIRSRANRKEKEKRKSDLIFAIKKDASNMVRYRLNKTGGSKNGESSSKYFPWTDEELWAYLEALFYHPDNLTIDGKVWMTKENRGKYVEKQWNSNDPSTWIWQLDHINPHINFHYETMDCQEFRDCWDLSNLRPLSAKQNIEDKNYRTPEQIAQIKEDIKIFLESIKNKKEAA